MGAQTSGTAWVPVLAPSFTGCVTSSKLFYFSLLQFPHLENEDDNGNLRIVEWIKVRFLTHSKSCKSTRFTIIFHLNVIVLVFPINWIP